MTAWWNSMKGAFAGGNGQGESFFDSSGNYTKNKKVALYFYHANFTAPFR